MEKSNLPDFSIVVACDKERGIGVNNELPWDLPGDLRFFSQITKTTTTPHQQNAVIMGRKTWDSIPAARRPLAGRLNIVISRQSNYELPNGVLLANSLDEALALAKAHNVEAVHNIGGAQIFATGMSHASCKIAYITEVDGMFNCDTFLPALPDDFSKVAESAWQEENGIRYRFTEYRR